MRNKSISRLLTTPTLLTPLAAGLAFSASGTASASIVYNGTSYNYTSNTTFDITTDHQFSLNVQPAKPDYNDNTVIKPSTVNLAPTQMTTVTTSTLNFGDIVNQSDNFTTAPIALGDGQHYVGFTLLGINPEDTNLYGWISVTHDRSTIDGEGSGTVNEWAYEDSGAAISVGAMAAVPEPSTALVGALLAGSTVAFARRRRRLESLAA